MGIWFSIIKLFEPFFFSKILNKKLFNYLSRHLIFWFMFNNNKKLILIKSSKTDPVQCFKEKVKFEAQTQFNSIKY